MDKTEFIYYHNGFYSGEYAVSFLQDKVNTVCLIAHRKCIDETYTGITKLNPRDVFDPAFGRHKAFKRALEKGITAPGYYYDGRHLWGRCVIPDYCNKLPIKQLQRDYWRRYGKEESIK